MQVWDLGYTPTSGQDPNQMVALPLDRGMGNNPGKTMFVNPYNQLYDDQTRSGSYYYNFHNHAYDMNGKPWDAYTGPETMSITKP
jgi:hypothetical protein